MKSLGLIDWLAIAIVIAGIIWGFIAMKARHADPHPVTEPMALAFSVNPVG